MFKNKFIFLIHLTQLSCSDSLRGDNDILFVFTIYIFIKIYDVHLLPFIYLSKFMMSIYYCIH